MESDPKVHGLDAVLEELAQELRATKAALVELPGDHDLTAPERLFQLRCVVAVALVRVEEARAALEALAPPRPRAPATPSPDDPSPARSGRHSP